MYTFHNFSSIVALGFELPSNWVPMSGGDKGVLAVELSTTDDEYQAVSQHFLQSLATERRIVSVCILSFDSWGLIFSCHKCLLTMNQWRCDQY